MARFGRGLICLALTEERADYLRLAPMTSENTSRFGTAFTESIEAREGVTTGISAADRAHTIRVVIDPRSTATTWRVRATSFPCARAKAACWCAPADRGLGRSGAHGRSGLGRRHLRDHERGRHHGPHPDLIAFCATHGLKMLTVASLIRYACSHERYIQRVAESILPTRYGDSA